MHKKRTKKAKNFREWIDSLPFADRKLAKTKILDTCNWSKGKWNHTYQLVTAPTPADQAAINQIAGEILDFEAGIKHKPMHARRAKVKAN